MTAKMSVTAKVPANKEKGTAELGPASISVITGATAKEMIEMFGDEAVKTNAQANWTVALQSAIRSGLKKGETPEQIQVRLGTAKMGISVKGATVDPKQAYEASFMSMSSEEQIAEIKKLQARAAEKAKGK